MQIETKSNNENAIRKLVCKKWLSSMREELSSSSISTDSISDKEMEDCYNFFIGLKYIQLINSHSLEKQLFY